MRVLVTGAAGRLGRVSMSEFSRRHEVTATTVESLDIRDHRAVEAVVAAVKPQAIVNCAAYTDVDGSVEHPVDALEINAFAVRSLAAAAARHGAVLVHYSTDFVFDGSSDRPYTEDDRPNPRSTYACSKLVGEWLASEAPRHYVLRVESLFGDAPGPAGLRTSVDRIVDALLAGRPARVFVDRTVSPSYTLDVARATRALIERAAPPGLYHCVNAGSCTWAELGAEAARQLGVETRLEPVMLADAGLKAERPRYCALSVEKLRSVGIEMRSWQAALADYCSTRLT